MVKKNSEKGFTMIEVLASIYLITVGVMGVFALVQQIISFADISSSRLAAIYLAQEGIEIVRNIRDGNWLKGRAAEVSWDEGLPAGIDYNADYRTQFLPDPNCTGGYLKLDGNFYICSADSSVKFQRKITISDKIDLDGDPEGKPDKMKIFVEVIWQERGRTHKVRAQENLYRWH